MSSTQDMIALIEPLIPGLRRYARGLLRDTAAADDLVQDCLKCAIGRWQQRHADGASRQADLVSAIATDEAHRHITTI